MGATGLRDGAALCFTISDDAGDIVAAVAGYTWGGYGEIRQLFVMEPFRGKGYGTALLKAAEDEAQRRGCFHLLVTTYSFQAPEFYRRHGFDEIGRIEGLPHGHARISLMKTLPISPEPRTVRGDTWDAGS